VLHHRHGAELEDMMVNETPNPLNHVVTMKGKEDGDQVTFRVPPGMAKMFPLEMTVDATVNFEVLA
jgi:hypothetical protein